MQNASTGMEVELEAYFQESFLFSEAGAKAIDTGFFITMAFRNTSQMRETDDWIAAKPKLPKNTNKPRIRMWLIDMLCPLCSYYVLIFALPNVKNKKRTKVSDSCRHQI